MTLPRLNEIQKHQQDNPPMYRLLDAIARYCGIEKKEKSTNEADQPCDSGLDENGNSFFDLMPQG